MDPDIIGRPRTSSARVGPCSFPNPQNARVSPLSDDADARGLQAILCHDLHELLSWYAGGVTLRLPSLNGLRAFEAAARHLSFTRAAAELNGTQTAISHQIRRLEEQLGLRLFVRRQRTLVLTNQAHQDLPAVRAAFADLRPATDRSCGSTGRRC